MLITISNTYMCIHSSSGMRFKKKKIVCDLRRLFYLPVSTPDNILFRECNRFIISLPPTPFPESFMGGLELCRGRNYFTEYSLFYTFCIFSMLLCRLWLFEE